MRAGRTARAAPARSRAGRARANASRARPRPRHATGARLPAMITRTSRCCSRSASPARSPAPVRVEAADGPRSLTRVPDRLVVLTFDDAVRSHYTTVAPLLERYGFGATFFVTEFPQPPFSDTTLYMTWAQIGDLNRRGFEVANHTWKHTHVDRMDARAIRRRAALRRGEAPLARRSHAGELRLSRLRDHAGRRAPAPRARLHLRAHRRRSRVRSRARRPDARPELDAAGDQPRHDPERDPPGAATDASSC